MTKDEREAALREGFLQGVAWAAAVVVQLHDRPTIAKDIVNESGLPLAAFAVAAEDDLQHLRAELPTLPHGRS